MAPLTSVDEALRLVLARATPLESERVRIDDADGRVLVTPASAAVDLPPFPSSSMDGYAIRSADAPGRLSIVDRVAAGRPTRRVLGPGEAIDISTGGVVPDGADAVVPIEVVRVEGDELVVSDPVVSSANVRERGGDVRSGDVLAPAGTVISPGRLAALAAAGVAEVACARRPRVAVVTTGTELRSPGEVLAPGQIFESNGPMLAAVFARAGADVSLQRAVADDDDAHRAALAAALEADVVITSGGVSVGPHDLVRATLGGLGATEVFWGVSMRPGKPLLFATRGDTLVFGLPGNPVSSLVGAVLFVVPALLALQGAAMPGPLFERGTLGAPLGRRPERDDFPRARIETTGEGVVLLPLVGQESHMIVASSSADAIVRIPAGIEPVPAGSRVDYLRLDGGPTGP
jgi:molybdopterin molybdotransferase